MKKMTVISILLGCMISNILWANACYRECKKDKECIETCGKVWSCGSEGYCLPNQDNKKEK